MRFEIQPTLLSNSAKIIDWSLSTLLLKNEGNYRWFLLVPRRDGITEITDLAADDQLQLMREINSLSNVIQSVFDTDKLNVASIGNQVPQLHVHVVGRFKHDPLWPESIWQANYKPEYLDDEIFAKQVEKIKKAINLD